MMKYPWNHLLPEYANTPSTCFSVSSPLLTFLLAGWALQGANVWLEFCSLWPAPREHHNSCPPSLILAILLFTFIIASKLCALPSRTHVFRPWPLYHYMPSRQAPVCLSPWLGTQYVINVTESWGVGEVGLFVSAVFLDATCEDDADR